MKLEFLWKAIKRAEPQTLLLEVNEELSHLSMPAAGFLRNKAVRAASRKNLEDIYTIWEQDGMESNAQRASKQVGNLIKKRVGSGSSQAPCICEMAMVATQRWSQEQGKR